MDRELGSTRTTVWAGPHKGAEAALRQVVARDGRDWCVLELDDGTTITLERAALVPEAPLLVREIGS